MIYFRGCVVRERLSGIADATEKLLIKAGVQYRTIENESCCGSFLKRTGFQTEAYDVMKKTLEDISYDNETVLVSCAGCYNTFKNDYKEIFGVDLEVVHTSELFNRLINEEKLVLKNSPTRITYHDPCHLGRHSSIYDEPREIINKTGLLVDMKRTRERSRCCGAGAGVKSSYPETAEKISLKRIQDAEETSAELLVTSCSFCILNLESALKQYCEIKSTGDKHSISNVLDITELILMRLEK